MKTYDIFILWVSFFSDETRFQYQCGLILLTLTLQDVTIPPSGAWLNRKLFRDPSVFPLVLSIYLQSANGQFRFKYCSSTTGTGIVYMLIIIISSTNC